MPTGLIRFPYSSKRTLLIQNQSPLRKSLTFIFSLSISTKNKGVVELTKLNDRASSLLSMTSFRGGGCAVYHSLAFRRARSILSNARQKSFRKVGFSNSRIVKLVKIVSRLAKSSFLVTGFRFHLSAIFLKILLINIFVLIFFDVI